MKKVDFETGLQLKLRRCELEYTVDYYYPKAVEVPCMAEACETLDGIVSALKEMGYRIAEVMDDTDCTGETFQWVTTKNGIIVYKNNYGSKGLAARKKEQ